MRDRCAGVGFLEPAAVGVTLMAGPVVAVVACGGSACWLQKSSRSAGMRTQSTASNTSVASGGMLMEQAIASDDELGSTGDVSQYTSLILC